MKYILGFVLLLSFFSSCNHKTESEVAEQIFKKLKSKEAGISMIINGREFYPAGSIFKGQVKITDQLISVMLIDTNESRLMIDLGGENWFKAFPVVREFKTGKSESASVKIGKMKDRIKMIGEGYMLVDGTLTLRELTNEKLIFSIKGNVGKYSDFQQPDKLYPVDGWIVYKEPDMHFENITAAEIIKNEKVK